MNTVERNSSLRFAVWLLSCAVLAGVLYLSLRGDNPDEAISSEERVEPVEELIQGRHPAVSESFKEQPATNRPDQVDPAVLDSGSAAVVSYPARLSKVLGQDDDILDVSSRISLLEAQGNLSSAELVSIYTYLEDGQNSSGLDDAHWLWLKNDLMTYLRESDTDRGRYFEKLSGLFKHNEDSVIRDYSLQHLTVMALAGEYEEDVRDILKQAAVVKEGTIAGTALLGYSRLVDEQQENADWLRSAAEDVASSNRYDSASRASALQVLANFDSALAQTLASEKALEATSSPMERVSAVAVLGRSEENFDTLKVLASDTDPRVRRAARSAISKFNTFE